MKLVFVLLLEALGAFSLSSTNFSRRIIKGTEVASIKDFSYQALYLSYYKYDHPRPFLCGAVLVSNKYALTAGQCFALVPGGRWRTADLATGVKYIDGELNENNDNVMVVQGNLKLIHPEFGQWPVRNDIAIITLHPPVLLLPVTLPVDLLPSSEADSMFVGQTGIISGYGEYDYFRRSAFLRSAEVVFQDAKVCEDSKSFQAGTFLCLKAKNGQIPSRGDSGGPVVIKSADGSVKLVGIISWTRNLSHPDDYFLATKIGKYLDWIKNHTEKVVQP